jgi:hypothetical protein
MTRPSAMQSKDPDIVASTAALKRAARRALQLGLETRTPVWVMKNGKMIDLAREVRRRRRKR